MELHLPTLYFAAIVISAALTLVTAAAAWRNPSLRLYSTAGALGLSLLAFVIFRYRDDFGSSTAVTLGNLAMSLALSEYAVGLLAMLHRRMRGWLRWLPVALTGVLSLTLAHEQRWRLIAVGIVLGLQAGVLLWTLLQYRKSRRWVGYWFVVAGVLSCMLTFALRAVLSVLGPGEVAGVNVAAVMSLVTVVALLAGMVFLATGTLVMALEQQVNRNRRMALLDPLTGLPNRRHARDHLPRALSAARRAQQSLALLMLDVDHFKQVNDTHGHPAGDAVLQRLGQTLRKRLRAHDMAARFGGEEFLVMLPDTDIEGAVQVASVLRETIAQERIALSSGQEISVTVSIGLCATTVARSTTADAMIAAADEALYLAKAQGRNCVRVQALPAAEFKAAKRP